MNCGHVGCLATRRMMMLLVSCIAGACVDQDEEDLIRACSLIEDLEFGSRESFRSDTEIADSLGYRDTLDIWYVEDALVEARAMLSGMLPADSAKAGLDLAQVEARRDHMPNVELVGQVLDLMQNWEPLLRKTRQGREILWRDSLRSELREVCG